MGDSEATTVTTETNFSNDATSSILECEAAFYDIFVTPNLDEVKKEHKGKKTEPIFSIVAADPASVKDSILEQTTKTLNKYEKISQKVEAQLKLDSKTDDEKSYVPGSLQKKNAIKVPSYLKGNDRSESIAKKSTSKKTQR